MNILSKFQIGSFSIVMATGIVSLAARLSGFIFFSNILFFINNIVYFYCLMSLAMKALFYFRLVVNDISHYKQGPKYLTFIAASSLLGVQYTHHTSTIYIPISLFLISILFYLFFMVTIFIGMMVEKTKPTLSKDLDGTWLLFTVSGAGIIILGQSIALYFPFTFNWLYLFLGIWCVSLMLYFIIITFVIFQWFFEPLKESEFSSTWWINMGALAISSLAGCHLILLIKNTSFGFLSYFILGTTIFLWLISLWWGGLLVIFSLYRIINKKLNLKYTISNWSAVFPMGMICVASLTILEQLSLPYYVPFADIIVVCVCIIWGVRFIQLVFTLLILCYKKWHC